MRAILFVVAGAALLLLAGCMSSGTQVSDDQLSGFVRGRTTESEVIARLGPPDATERSASGAHVDTYEYQKVNSGFQNFIPVIGPLIGNVDAKTRVVRFTFDGRNVLQDWTATGSSQRINQGPFGH